MEFEKFRNFCWGIAFGTCLSGIIHHEHFIIPAIIMVLIGVMFIINLKNK
jgi:hypothetical protein